MFKKLAIILTSLAIVVSPLASMKVLAATNLLANPSVETADSTGNPANWTANKWGTNTTTMTYQTGGHSGSKSLYINMSARTSGDAKWMADPVTVSPSAQYTYTDYYQSSVATELDAQYTDSTGAVSYAYLSSVPASATWKQSSVTFTTPANVSKIVIMHLVYSAGWLQIDDFSLTGFSVPAAPSVNVTSPVSGSSVSGATTLSANASDSSGIAGVQFQVDGTNVGSEDTTAPYQVSWDSSSVTNGSHNITAIARNTSNITTTSSAVAVTVSNTVTPPPATTNLIANPSVETADSNNPLQPQSWQTAKTGTNTTAFNYLNSGHTGSRSIQVNMTSRSSGNAKWYFTPISVNPNTTYTFTDWYQSNVASNLQVAVTTTSGATSNIASASLTKSSVWKKSSITFTTPSNAKTLTVYHYLNRVGQLTTDDFDIEGPAQTNPTPPTVNLTAPAANATVSGVQTVTATATDTQGIANVQFKLDGNNLGTADTTSPYSISWDTSTVPNGNHTLSAVATNTSGLTGTSTSITVNVQNSTANPGVIPNSSVETPDPANPQLPDSWTYNSWGTNTASFQYLSNDGHSGSHSVKVTVSNYTDGDAKWYFSPITTLTPGAQYRFTTWYKTNAIPHAVAMFLDAQGSEHFFGMPNPQPGSNSSTVWQQYSETFQVPSYATAVSAFLFMPSNGWLQVDDQSIGNYSPVGWNRPLVTLTFDDSEEDNVTTALPLLQSYGFKFTQCFATTFIEGNQQNMNNVLKFRDAGEEICDHTVTHPFLTQLSTSQVDYELSHSQTFLQNLTGQQVIDFASPYGDYNAAVNTEIMKYYQAHRTVDEGYNSKDNLDPYRLRVQNMLSTTTLAEFQGWIDQAKKDNTWLIIVYHRVANNPEAYDTTISNFQQQMAALNNSGLTVKTMKDALAEVKAQL